MTTDRLHNTELYTPQFFVMFAALFLFMCGYNLLAHFAQFIDKLGGTVATVGWIVGIGMIGSLLTRPIMGPAIDRAGCKPIMLGAAFTAAATMCSFQWCENLYVVCVLRVLMQLSLSAFLVGIAVFSAQIAPPGRSAESLASVGIGGLAGMILGPTLGDFIFTGREQLESSYHLYFSLGAALSTLCALLILVLPAPRGAQPQLSTRGLNPISFFRLVRRHWPGAIVIMALAMACAQAIPQTFVERLAEARGFANVKCYFLAYGLTAITLRVLFRRAPQVVGRRRMLLIGATCYAVGVLLLAGAWSERSLIIPAMIMGAGHCFSYPLIVDLAAERMPLQHRGAATALILGMVDIGFLFANVTWGKLINGLDFDVTLPIVAVTIAAFSIYYGFTQRRIIFRKTAPAIET